MEIVNGHISKCCKTSVSGHNGATSLYELQLGRSPNHYHTCNSCGKVCVMLTVPMWELTDKLKYRRLTKKELENLEVSN